MATDKQLQATFDEFHRASAILKMRLANSPHSEQTEVQRRKVQALREKLLDQVYRQLGFDVNQPSQNEDAVLIAVRLSAMSREKLSLVRRGRGLVAALIAKLYIVCSLSRTFLQERSQA
jgi:hypothetical protein